ncbi:MAG: non-canonical purine NTP pyrophosphatase [Candidatus Pacebacteria bacterium]|nr:non-canonical purine NTP pyrophosphatase [Candidatus Paceibacterota bacterium]
MKKIYFITSNKAKIKSLKEQLLDKGLNIEVEGKNLNIIEPQADNVKDVSLIKAKEAFSILKQPLIVEDGGFEIEALNGFPGVYAKYILKTIGIDGILKLMKEENNRNCKSVSCTTFVNEKGEIYQFERIGGKGIISEKKSLKHSDFAWSDFWYVFYIPRFNKTLNEMTKEELFDLWSNESEKSSITVFIKWLENNKK